MNMTVLPAFSVRVLSCWHDGKGLCKNNFPKLEKGDRMEDTVNVRTRERSIHANTD